MQKNIKILTHAALAAYVVAAPIWDNIVLSHSVRQYYNILLRG